MLEEFGKRDAIEMLEEEQKKILKWINRHPRTNIKQYLLRLYASYEMSIQALRREVEGRLTIEQMHRMYKMMGGTPRV